MRTLAILCSLLTLVLLTDTASAASFRCPYLADKTKQTISEMTQGKDGWFFRIQGDLEEEFLMTSETAQYFTRLVDALDARDTTLIFITIPPRGMVAYDFLDRSIDVQADFDKTKAETSFNDLVVALQGTGLIAPNITSQSDLGADFFFHRDIHWTPEGARIAAKTLASILKDNTHFQSMTPAAFETVEASRQTIKERMGLELQRLCTSDIPPEPYVQYETRRKDTKDASALFGDAEESEASVLVGSSFSALEWFNFDGFISEYTGLDIANHALAAGHLFNAIVSYTSSPQFVGARPPFMIWEAPAIYDLNNDTAKFFRQVIPAIHGPCGPSKALAKGSLTVKNGKGGLLMTLDPAKKISGNGYFLFIESSNKGLAEMTLDLEYDDEDGEWFTIDRSEHFKNYGRFFIELSDDIESALSTVQVDGLSNVNATLTAYLCQTPTASNQGE